MILVTAGDDPRGPVGPMILGLRGPTILGHPAGATTSSPLRAKRILVGEGDEDASATIGLRRIHDPQSLDRTACFRPGPRARLAVGSPQGEAGKRGKTMNRIPTEAERLAERERQRTIRKEMSKPIEQYLRGLLTAEEFLDSMVESYYRGSGQDRGN